MANGVVLLSDLQTGRSSSSVQVRLLRFWEARYVRRGGELMKVDMLLLDSQATMMPAKLTEQWKWFDGKILYQFMYRVTVSSYFDRSIITRLYDEQQQYRQKPENREQQKLKSLKRNRDKTGSHVLIVDHPHNDSEI
ncbi:unnamed protein product [Brassica rapa]|uniref:DUF223 domain-containing protein n=2 Tax=Brassica TaxID=3705 RepID=A0A3P5ZSC7_BRACM|nr:unnamed protein product [Brassica napus]CAG7887414.1 unnamed protein product [Brassica rapa]CDY44111.1 BnaA01g13190D [Brassica napus]VDC74918.1 unnamed protein product [Brassica rapa]